MMKKIGIFNLWGGLAVLVQTWKNLAKPNITKCSNLILSLKHLQHSEEALQTVQTLHSIDQF